MGPRGLGCGFTDLQLHVQSLGGQRGEEGAEEGSGAPEGNPGFAAGEMESRITPRHWLKYPEGKAGAFTQAGPGGASTLARQKIKSIKNEQLHFLTKNLHRNNLEEHLPHGAVGPVAKGCKDHSVAVSHPAVQLALHFEFGCGIGLEWEQLVHRGRARELAWEPTGSHTLQCPSLSPKPW